MSENTSFSRIFYWMQLIPFCICSKHNKHICSWRSQQGHYKIELQALWWPHFCVALHIPVSLVLFSLRLHIVPWLDQASLLILHDLFCSVRDKKHFSQMGTYGLYILGVWWNWLWLINASVFHSWKPVLIKSLFKRILPLMVCFC